MFDSGEELIVENDSFNGIRLGILRGNRKHEHAVSTLVNCALLSYGGKLIVEVGLDLVVKSVELLVPHIQQLYA